MLAQTRAFVQMLESQYVDRLFQTILCVYIHNNHLQSCPGANGAKGSNDVELVHGERIDGIQRVRYRRPMASGDACDRPFDTFGKTRVVWATGPITYVIVVIIIMLVWQFFLILAHDSRSETSSLVVNIHGVPNVPGRSGHAPLNNAPSTFFHATSTPGNAACSQVPSRAAQVSPTPPACFDVVVGRRVFNVTVEDKVREGCATLFVCSSFLYIYIDCISKSSFMGSVDSHGWFANAGVGCRARR
jgi:hypothetical protein